SLASAMMVVPSGSATCAMTPRFEIVSSRYFVAILSESRVSLIFRLIEALASGPFVNEPSHRREKRKELSLSHSICALPSLTRRKTEFPSRNELTSAAACRALAASIRQAARTTEHLTVTCLVWRPTGPPHARR